MSHDEFSLQTIGVEKQPQGDQQPDKPGCGVDREGQQNPACTIEEVQRPGQGKADLACCQGPIRTVDTVNSDVQDVVDDKTAAGDKHRCNNRLKEREQADSQVVIPG